jgi:hypothetical protein
MRITLAGVADEMIEASPVSKYLTCLDISTYIESRSLETVRFLSDVVSSRVLVKYGFDESSEVVPTGRQGGRKKEGNAFKHHPAPPG